MKRTLGCISSLLVTCLAHAEIPVGARPAASDQDVATFATKVRGVEVRTGVLRGRVVKAGARQPVKGASIKVCDKTGKQVCELTTAADGTYTTPALANGEYTLQLPDSVTMNIVVTEKATISYLDILVPQGPKTGVQDPSKVPAAPGGAAPVAGAAPITPGLGVGTWAVIAGGGAAAVAIPVAASGGSSGGENQVSASGLGLRR